MKAKLKHIHSPDFGADPFEKYIPTDLSNFSVFIQIIVGPADGEGEESFDLVICTPQWLHNEVKAEPIMGRHYLIVDKFDYKKITKFIENYIQKCEGHSWSELADKIGRIGRWEFEDYQPFKE